MDLVKNISTYDGKLYDHFRFQWMWKDGYNNNLVLDYGRAGISYMDDVFVTGNRFRGTFYLSADSPGFDFVLEME